MKNLLTVLKKLGKKMTGSDITGTNLVTVVDDIANKYTGGSGGGGEGGGCDCTLVVGVTTDGLAPTLNKTWQEIHDALVAGKQVVVPDVNENGVTQTRIIQAYADGPSFFVRMDNDNYFKIDTATGYPVYYHDDDNPVLD